MEVDKRVLAIARVTDDESSKYAIGCVEFQTDGHECNAFATNGHAAIRANWPVLIQPDGPELFLVPASDCKQVKSAIKRIDKRSVAQLKDEGDFTLFTDFNAIGSVYRSPKPTGGAFPEIHLQIKEFVRRMIGNESMRFDIGLLVQLLKAVEEVIGSNGRVDLSFDRTDGEHPGIVVDGAGNDNIAQGVLLAIS